MMNGIEMFLGYADIKEKLLMERYRHIHEI